MASKVGTYVIYIITCLLSLATISVTVVFSKWYFNPAIIFPQLLGLLSSTILCLDKTRNHFVFHWPCFLGLCWAMFETFVNGVLLAIGSIFDPSGGFVFPDMNQIEQIALAVAHIFNFFIYTIYMFMLVRYDKKDVIKQRRKNIPRK